MKIYEATEQAYKNGYEDGYRDGKGKAVEEMAFPKILARPPETTKEELEALMNSPTTILMDKESITQIYPYSRWIPVAERLPEVEDEYLVVVKYKYDHEKEYSVDTDVAMYSPYQGGYIDNCWNTYNDWNEGQQYLHVTHWMPLPEPPKEVSDNV